MGIVDELIAAPGTYVGIDRMSGTDLTGEARIVVTPLPGGSGVTLDYEVLHDGRRAHVEHTILARTSAGTAIMVIGHPHADTVAVLRETEPGVFELGDEPSPFPMRVLVSAPEPGRIRHSWWYDRPGGTATERDVAEVTRLDE